MFPKYRISRLEGVSVLGPYRYSTETVLSSVTLSEV